MSKLELTSLNCTSCGASISGYEGKNEIQCEYCNTSIKILRPRSVTAAQDNLSNDNYEKLNNYIEILQKAIRAGNYNEGYDYCNKALEINPNIGSIWENKAICAFWRSVSLMNEDKISVTNAREIKTFLKASKENDPESETYAETADAIGSNLYIITKFKLSIQAADELKKVGKAEIRVFKDIVLELSNFGVVEWWSPKNSWGSAVIENAKKSDNASRSGVDVERKRSLVIEKIKKLEINYLDPGISLKVIPKALKYLLIGVSLFLLIIQILKK
jgi:DNA-directed RNA polymerase subunit RPC12/RpoP